MLHVTQILVVIQNMLHLYFIVQVPIFIKIGRFLMLTFCDQGEICHHLKIGRFFDILGFQNKETGNTFIKTKFVTT